MQFVKIIVDEWFNEIGLRFEVMGCPSKFGLFFFILSEEFVFLK